MAQGRKFRQKFRANRQVTGVDNTGAPLNDNGIEFVEISSRVKRAIAAALKKQGATGDDKLETQKQTD